MNELEILGAFLRLPEEWQRAARDLIRTLDDPAASEEDRVRTRATLRSLFILSQPMTSVRGCP